MFQIIFKPLGKVSLSQWTCLYELYELNHPFQAKRANDMLNFAGILLGCFSVNAQSLHKKAGQRLMTAEHIAGNLITFGGELYMAISLMLHKPLFGEFF